MTSPAVNRLTQSLFCVSTWAMVGLAADLSSPFTTETAQVLPSGVRNPRFINFLMNPELRFGRDGNEEPLGARLNKSVSWNDVLESQTDDAQKNVIRSLLKDNHLSADGSPGNATGEVHAHVDVKVPVLAMGVTKTWTLAIAVPIVAATVSVDTGFVRSNDGQTFVNAACDQSPEKCNEAARKLNDATNQKVARLGYEPIRSQSVSGIGDIQLMSKLQLQGDSSSGLTTKTTLTLPTGSVPNPDRALDVTTGDGRYKLGGMLIYDHRIIPQARVDLYGGYTALLPSSMVKRLPTSEDDSLSADKENLTRAWGHLISFGTMLDFHIDPVGMTLGGGYSFQYQTQTHYQGTASNPVTQHRYALLDDLEPSQALHSLLVTVGFSTVEWYLSKTFFLPFQANLVFSKPIAGRNAPTQSVISGEMVFFL